MFNTPLWLAHQQELIYSMDLTEATYNISPDIMEDNFEFISDVFKDNPIWEVYQDLFKITDRKLDLSIICEQGFDAPVFLEVKQGSFMGDGLSFMHLTMMLSSIVNLSSTKREQDLHKVLVERPFGQSVGDDLVLLNAKFWQCQKFNQTLRDFNLEVSKINSIFISGVFAEQYFIKVTDQRDKSKIPNESLFGDLWFVDSIKTMLLTGKPKVSAEKKNSFIGQANALNKQLAYFPESLSWKRLRCRVYLWVFNYDEAVKLGRAKPHLPPELGGLSIPIGACDGPKTELMREKYIPYWIRMTRLPQAEFTAYYLLLKGIFKSAPKGVPWSNDPDRVMAIANTANILHFDEVNEKVKDLDFYARLGAMERLRYLNKTHGWVSASQIDDELSRRETYLDFWYNPTKKRAFRTLKTHSAAERHTEIWKFIRINLEPALPSYYQRGDELFSIIAREFRDRIWGFFVNRNDPAISWVFEGVNSFYVDFNDLE